MIGGGRLEISCAACRAPQDWAKLCALRNMSIPAGAVRRGATSPKRKDSPLQYLCLAFYDPEKFAAMAPDEVQALVGQCPALDEQLKASGALRVSASLAGTDGVINLRPRGGKPQVTDGPFTESKELVGGFFIIEAADRDEAVRVASLHPTATLGEQVGWGLEIHPIDFFEQYPDVR
jgi:hypothetical protein